MPVLESNFIYLCFRCYLEVGDLSIEIEVARREDESDPDCACPP